jgi:hypothetical protein
MTGGAASENGEAVFGGADAPLPRRRHGEAAPRRRLPRANPTEIRPNSPTTQDLYF